MACGTISFTLLVILGSSLVASTAAQSTQIKTSWNVIESLETLSKAVQGLQAKIELQTALLSNFDAKLETQASLFKNSLRKLEATLEIQATALKDLVAKEEWQEPNGQSSTKRTMMALEGDDVEMWCVVRGTPLPEIRWTRDRTLASDRVAIENSGKVLRIKNVQLSDEGSYVCVAANGVGTPATQSVHLEVYGKYVKCKGVIEAEKGSLEIEPSSASCLLVIKLEKTTGFRLQLDPLMTEPILVIAEETPSNSSVQSIRVTGSKDTSFEFEGKSLAIVVPPGRERSTLRWRGLDLDGSGVSSSTKFLNDFQGTLEWESTSDGTDKILWAFDHEFRGELNWKLNTTFTARDRENLCKNISFSVLQVRPDGNFSEIEKTCDGSSEGSLKFEISSQILVLLHIKSLEAARSKLWVSWTRYDDPLKKNFDGIIAGSETTGIEGALVIPFNSSQTKELSPGQVFGLTFDWNSRRVYYVKHNVGIIRSNLDGTESEILLAERSSTLYGLHVEPTSGNLYYGNWTSRSISVCNNDANKCSTIANSSDLSSVFDFAVHRSKGLLFWSIYGQKVVRANLDGSNATVILQRNVWGLDLDENEDRLYWGSWTEGIESCDLNGQDIWMLPNLSAFIADVAVDGDKVYYTDVNKKSIHVISKSGTNSRLVAQLTANNLRAITLFGTTVSNPGWNPCEKSDCAHLCVLVTRWTYKCICPDNKELKADGKTCTL